jgi:Undecaprenyl-phosphate glucose phosphotransferase
MNQARQNLLTSIRYTVDMLMVCLAWLVSYHIRFHFGIEAPKGIPEFNLYMKLLPFVVVIWSLSYFMAGLYRRSTKHRSAVIEAIDILQSSFFATLCFVAFTYFYDEYRYSRIVIVLFGITHPLFVIAGRSLVRKALRRYRRKVSPRKTLIVGSGDFLKVAISMARHGDIAVNEIFGVILVNDIDEKDQGMALCKSMSVSVINQPQSWPDFFASNSIQTVVVALPHRSFSWIEQNLEQIANQVPDVKLVPDLMKFTKLSSGIEIISGLPVISIHESPLVGIQGVVKRFVDILGACFAIFIFSPAMIAVAVFVKLSSPGPVLYRQERMGLDGAKFWMMKFRSMPVNAEQSSGAVFAKATDNRATPFGKFIRKTSLDELPQFFNVLLGDMSLVGPRPERPVFVNSFRSEIPGYFLRHKVRAGITGWAQVNGWRGDTSIERRIECDLYYIQNWSLWLDVKILFMTVYKGFVHKNAY